MVVVRIVRSLGEWYNLSTIDPEQAFVGGEHYLNQLFPFMHILSNLSMRITVNQLGVSLKYLSLIMHILSNLAMCNFSKGRIQGVAKGDIHSESRVRISKFWNCCIGSGN